MAEKKQFTWLASTCYTRRGALLECGKAYDVSDHGDEIVAYWVLEKAAKYAAAKSADGGK